MLFFTAPAFTAYPEKEEKKNNSPSHKKKK